MSKLDPARFALGEQVNQYWTVTVESGTTLEDVMRPEFLANVAARLRPYDRISVRVDTGEWYAEFLVVACGRVWAKLVATMELDFTDRNIEVSELNGSEDFFVKYRGPHLKFCVIRKADNEPIKERLDSMAEANSWLAAYLITT